MAKDAVATSTKKKRQIPGFSQMQRIGRSLMLPIASLPVAALLMRFGSADVLGADGLAKHASWMQPVADVLAGAGGAIFDNLPLIFALGVAVGYAKKADGSTALAALVGYLTFTGAGTSDKTQGGVLHALAPYFSQKTGVINYGVLGGIVIGLIAAKMYEKYRRTKLPTYLAFFGGRRLVPIVTAAASVVAGVIMAIISPAFDWLFNLSLIHISEPTRQRQPSRMPSSA